jgi:hypothetical protein
MTLKLHPSNPEEDIANRISALEIELAKLRSQSKKGNVLGALGAVAGGIALPVYAGEWVTSKVNAVEELYHGLQTASRMANLSGGSSASVERQLQYVPAELKQQFEAYLSNRDILSEAPKEALEVMQRESDAFPGQHTAPVEAGKGVKAWVLTKSKSWFKPEARKEEIKQTNTTQYTQNYNDLAKIRTSALEHREVSLQEMKSLASKVEQNEASSGAIDAAGRQRFESLVKEHNNACKVLKDIHNLKPGEIYQGKESASYITTTQEAKNYGITPFQPGAWADNAMVGLTILGAFAGYKAANIATAAYHTAEDIARGTYAVGRGAYHAGESIAHGIGRVNDVAFRAADYTLQKGGRVLGLATGATVKKAKQLKRSITKK